MTLIANPSPTLVVARYSEDLDWLQHSGCEHLILNKGNTPGPAYKAFKLPNIGYEAHAYLTYIVSHYFDLPPTMAFCQGDPFTHCPEILKMLQHDDVLRFVDQHGYLPLTTVPHHTTLIQMSYLKGSPETRQIGPFTVIREWCDRFGRPLSGGGFFNDGSLMELYDHLFTTPLQTQGFTTVAGLQNVPKQAWRYASAHMTFANDFLFSWGAQFLVSRDAVLQRSHGFYQRCLEQFHKKELSSVHHGGYDGGSIRSDKLVACQFEQLWGTIFDPKVKARL